MKNQVYKKTESKKCILKVKNKIKNNKLIENKFFLENFFNILG